MQQIPKPIKAVELYNLLQDLRHLVLIDLRQPEFFKKSHIRNSINIEKDPLDEKEKSNNSLLFINFDIKKNKDGLFELLGKMDKAALIQEQNYNSKKIRRIIFILDANQNGDIGNKKFQDFLKFLAVYQNILFFVNLNLKDEKLIFDKYFILKFGYQSFYEKYPFLCLDEVYISTDDINRLYPFSKFPSEIVEDQLYLGDVHNSNNKRQLKDLKIKSLIDLISYDKSYPFPEFKKSEFDYLHIPIDEKVEVIIDFDEMNQYIENFISKNSFPILLYCRNGDNISPALAIAFLMFKKKVPLAMASLMVFQKRPNMTIEKWIYTQLLTYVPNANKKQ